MRIALISTFFEPEVGGVETQVGAIARELGKTGEEVQVITTNIFRSGEKLKSGLEHKKYFSVARAPIWFKLSEFHVLYPSIWNYLRNFKPDVIHVHGIRKIESYFALLYKLLFPKTKVFVSTHNPFGALSHSKLQKLLLWLHDNTFGKLFTKYFDKVLVLLESEKEILKRNFWVPDRNLVVFPNMLEEKFFQNFSEEELALSKNEFEKLFGKKFDEFEQIVLAPARFNKIKGIQNLEMAAKEMPKTLFLFVGGDDGYGTELKRIYDGLGNVVIFDNYIPQTKLIKLYALVDILALPSLNEPFGLTPLEAASQSCVLVLTNVGGPKEIFSNKEAIFVDPNNQKDIYQKHKELKNKDLGIYRDLCFKKATKFRAKALIPKLKEIYLA